MNAYLLEAWEDTIFLVTLTAGLMALFQHSESVAHKHAALVLAAPSPLRRSIQPLVNVTLSLAIVGALLGVLNKILVGQITLQMLVPATIRSGLVFGIVGAIYCGWRIYDLSKTGEYPLPEFSEASTAFSLRPVLIAIVVTAFLGTGVWQAFFRISNEIGPLGADKYGRQIFLQSLDTYLTESMLAVNAPHRINVTSEFGSCTWT